MEREQDESLFSVFAVLGESSHPHPTHPLRLQRGVAGPLTPVMTAGQESGCVKEPSTSAERVRSAWEPELAVIL